FEVIAMTHESAERARNVGGDGRFLGDDQRFRHGGGCEERQIVPKSMRREQINLRLKQANARTYARARSRTHASATTGLPLFLRPLLPEPARHRRGATGELECEQRCSDDFRVKPASRD